MTSVSGASALAAIAADAANTLLSSYRGGQSHFPIGTCRDPYVLGFVNAVMLSVIDKGIRENGLTEFRNYFLQNARKLLPEPLNRALESYSDGLDSFFDRDYLRGREDGELCALVVDKRYPAVIPPILEEAIDLGSRLQQGHDLADGDVAGALLLMTLFRRGHEQEKLDGTASFQLSLRELRQAMRDGIRDAELDALHNLRARTRRLSAPTETQAHKEQETSAGHSPPSQAAASNNPVPGRNGGPSPHRWVFGSACG